MNAGILSDIQTMEFTMANHDGGISSNSKELWYYDQFSLKGQK